MKANPLHCRVILIILNVCFRSSLSINSTAEHAQRRLTTELLNNYGPRTIRPIKNISQPINVILRFLPSRLVRFDEVEQEVQLLASVRMIWTDENMMWDPNEYDGVDYVTVSHDDIWMPDIELIENIDKDFISHTNTYVEATYEGKMDWYFQALLTTTCPIDITYFPFDTQVCHMSFLPWTLDNSLVQFNRSKDQDASYDTFQRNGVWLLTHGVEDVATEYIGKSWSTVRIYLYIRREPGFYVKIIIIPSCLLTSLMTLICWLHPASGEKVTLAVNNLVAMILFQQLVADRIPPSGNSNSIIVNLFMLFIMLCCFEVACAIIVLRLYHTGNRKPLPTWMRKLITSRLITPLVNDRARHLFKFTSNHGNQIENHLPDRTADDACPNLASSQSGQRQRFCMNMLRGHQLKNCEVTEKVPVQRVVGQPAEGDAELLSDPEVNEMQWREAAMLCDRILFMWVAIITLAIWSYVLTTFMLRNDDKA